MSASEYPNRRKERGVLMFVVTIVISILALGGVALLGLMKVERLTTLEHLTQIQTDNADRSAVSLIQAFAELSRKRQDQLGGSYQNPALFRGVELLGTAQGARSDIRLTVLSPVFNREEIEGLRYGLTNESAKLNLTAILAWEEETPGNGRNALMKLPGMTVTMADSILDWIDPNEQTRSRGAEADFYTRKKLPYSPRNAVPVFLEELLLVRDVTRYQLYGTDEQFNFGDAENKVADAKNSGLVGSLQKPPERPKSGGVEVLAGDAAAMIPWSYLLTVYSAERDIDPEGEPRIDLNGDDLPFLFDELQAYTGEDIAAFVILYRQYGPSRRTVPEGGTVVQASGNSVDLSAPASFRMGTPLDIVGATVFVPNSDNPETGTFYASPLRDERGESKLFDYLDYVSTSRSTVITGRVNIQEAPRPVLEAVPDLTPSAVQRILNTRPAPGAEPSKEFRHAAWIYTEGIVDLAAMKKLWNKLTVSGEVWSGQIIGSTDDFGVTRRAEVVVDGTVSPARQVFYKDLSMYGPGFSRTVIGPAAAGDPENKIGSLLTEQTQNAAPFLDAESAPIEADPYSAVEQNGFSEFGP